jgi:excinuclease ABC subunit A
MVDAVLALPEDTRLMVLAPVVRDRKGEFTELFADMQAQRLRALSVRWPRCRGRRAARAEEEREARHRRRHRPPARARPDMKQRLAESFEAALRIADGRPSRWRWTRARAPVQQPLRLPGVQLRAARTGAAAVLVQLAGGRLPGSCDGLGQVTAFDPERVVAFPS